MFNDLNRPRGRPKTIPKSAKNRKALELIINDLAKRAGIQDPTSFYFYIEMSQDPKTALRDLDSAVKESEKALWEMRRQQQRRKESSDSNLFQTLPVELAQVCWKFGEERYRELILGEGTVSDDSKRGVSPSSASTATLVGTPSSLSSGFPSTADSTSIDSTTHSPLSTSTSSSPSSSPGIFNFSDPDVSPDTTPTTSPSDSDSEDGSCLTPDGDFNAIDGVLKQNENNSRRQFFTSNPSSWTTISILDSPLQPPFRKTQPARTGDPNVTSSVITSKPLDAEHAMVGELESERLTTPPAPKTLAQVLIPHLHEDAIDGRHDHKDNEFPSVRIPRVGSGPAPHYHLTPENNLFLQGSSTGIISVNSKKLGLGLKKEKGILSMTSAKERCIEMKLVRPPISPPPPLHHQEFDMRRKERSRSRSNSTTRSRSVSLSKSGRSYDSPISTSSSLPPTPPLTRSSSISSFASATTVNTSTGSTVITSSPPVRRNNFPSARLPAPPNSQMMMDSQFPIDLTLGVQDTEIESQSRAGLQYSYPYSQARYHPSPSYFDSVFPFQSNPSSSSTRTQYQQMFQLQTPRVRMCSDPMFWKRLALRNATRTLCGVRIISFHSAGGDDGEEKGLVLGWPRELIPLQRSANDSSFAIGISDEVDMDMDDDENRFTRRRVSEAGDLKSRTLQLRASSRSSRSASFSISQTQKLSSSHQYYSSSSIRNYQRKRTASTPLTDLAQRKSVARNLKGREGYLVRRKIFEEERVLRRVIVEPAVTHSRGKDGATRSDTTPKLHSRTGSEVIMDEESKEIDEGKLLSVCWEGRWRTRLMSSW